jgi:hypothetical protein
MINKIYLLGVDDVVVSYHATQNGAIAKAKELGLLRSGEALEQDLFSEVLTNQGGLIIEPVELCG